MSRTRHQPPGGILTPTRCACEPGQYDDRGLPVRGSGVYRHPECPIHGGTRMDGRRDDSDEAFFQLLNAHRGYGD